MKSNKFIDYNKYEDLHRVELPIYMHLKIPLLSFVASSVGLVLSQYLQ